MAAHAKKHSRLIGMMTMAMVMMINITIMNVKLTLEFRQFYQFDNLRLFFSILFVNGTSVMHSKFEIFILILHKTNEMNFIIQSNFISFNLHELMINFTDCG